MASVVVYATGAQKCIGQALDGRENQESFDYSTQQGAKS
jgi:hypothetical protein